MWGYILMKFEQTKINGVFIVIPDMHEDTRGYFMESYNWLDFNCYSGIETEFLQDNQSFNKKGVLRGLHYQKQYPQSKLVRVVKGKVLDVAVDIRKDSATYGQYVSVILSDENRKQLFIPRGFAHGFLTLEDDTIFCYKVDDYWHKGDEDGIIWNDSTINIDWPIKYVDGIPQLEDGTKLIFSDKDKQYSKLIYE